MELINEIRQPLQIVVAFFGFKRCPGKDPKGDQIDSGTDHAFDITSIGFLIPLFGVPIAAVGNRVHIRILPSTSRWLSSGRLSLHRTGSQT